MSKLKGNYDFVILLSHLGLKTDIMMTQSINNIDIIAKNKRVNIILIGEEQDVLYILEGLSKKGFKNLYYFENGYNGYVQAKGSEFVPELGCGC